MHHFEFHYQYQPDDLKAIRQANSEEIFSPASNITATAIGLAFSLLILGAIGAWVVLLAAVVIGFIIVVIYARKLNARSRGNREYKIRTLQLFDKFIVEIAGNSESRKSWDVLDECVETEQHFLLRHYQRIIAIPKRVMQVQEVQECRHFIAQRMGENASGPIAEFTDWFTKPGIEVFRFRWQQEDAEAIKAGKLAKFDPQRMQKSGAPNLTVIIACAALIIASLAAPLLLFDGPILNWNRLSQITIKTLICLLAISAPLLTIWCWRRYMAFRMRRQEIRIPTEVISIAQTDEFVVVGYRGAVSKYDLGAITTLYLSRQLLGFRLGGGPVNVIPVRAFGDDNTAREFLTRLLAKSQRKSKEIDNARDVIETGNPYQPPRL